MGISDPWIGEYKNALPSGSPFHTNFPFTHFGDTQNGVVRATA